jgi:hypothetical protein
MRYVVEAGTDAGSLLLFDPSALPEEFEQQFRKDPGEAFNLLSRRGQACRIATAADGAYLLHAYLDEPVPSQLARHAHEPQVIERFQVPSGRIFFSGSESAFRQAESDIRSDSQRRESVSIPAGVYRLTVWRTHFPDDIVQRQFTDQAPQRERLLWSSMRALIPLAIAAWIGLVVIFFTTVRVPFPDFLAPLLGLILALPLLVRRLDTYQAAKQRFANLERECPSIVALLETRERDAR